MFQQILGVFFTRAAQHAVRQLAVVGAGITNASRCSLIAALPRVSSAALSAVRHRNGDQDGEKGRGARTALSGGGSDAAGQR